MGWSINTKKAKGKELYRIYSNTSNSYITKWSTREQISEILFFKRIREFQSGLVEDYLTWPDGYHHKKTDKRLNNIAGWNAYHELLMKSISNKKAFDAPFTEIVSKLGYKVDIKKLPSATQVPKYKPSTFLKDTIASVRLQNAMGWFFYVDIGKPRSFTPTLLDVSKYTKSDLYGCRNLGANSITELEKILAAANLKLK